MQSFNNTVGVDSIVDSNNHEYAEQSIQRVPLRGSETADEHPPKRAGRKHRAPRSPRIGPRKTDKNKGRKTTTKLYVSVPDLNGQQNAIRLPQYPVRQDNCRACGYPGGSQSSGAGYQFPAQSNYYPASFGNARQPVFIAQTKKIKTRTAARTNATRGRTKRGTAKRKPISAASNARSKSRYQSDAAAHESRTKYGSGWSPSHLSERPPKRPMDGPQFGPGGTIFGGFRGPQL
jgi:hypothetical protein